MADSTSRNGEFIRTLGFHGSGVNGQNGGIWQFHEDIVWTKLDVKPAYGCYGFDQTLGDTPKRAIS